MGEELAAIVFVAFVRELVFGRQQKKYISLFSIKHNLLILFSYTIRSCVMAPVITVAEQGENINSNK